MARESQEKSKLTFVAEAISIPISPIVMIILMVFGVCIKYSISLLNFTVILLPFFLFTLAYIFYKFVIKHDSDYDMTKLKMRRYLGIPATIGFAISFLLAHQFYPFLDEMFLRAWIIILITGLVTLRWKISLHSIGYSCFCFTFIELFGPIWIITLLFLPLVYWDRLILKRHTLKQLLAGTILSLLILV
jgi:hypothetical protein